MTNKLPEVGKRYKSNEIGFPSELICMDITYSHLNGVRVHGNSKTDIHRYNLDLFWKVFEELPEDNSNQKHTSKTHQLEENTPVENAKEGLERCIKNQDCTYNEFIEVAQNLLNALDNQQSNHFVDANKKVGEMRVLDERWAEFEGNIYKIKENETLTFTAGNIIAKDKDGNEIYPSYYGRPVIDKSTNQKFENYKLKVESLLNSFGSDCFVCNSIKEELDNYRNQPTIKGNSNLQKMQNALSDEVEKVKETETKLPWKDVSELPEYNSQLIFQTHNNFTELGHGYEDIIWDSHSNVVDLKTVRRQITLTDLINSIESMLSRQDELEERIRKLVGR